MSSIVNVGNLSKPSLQYTVVPDFIQPFGKLHSPNHAALYILEACPVIGNTVLVLYIEFLSATDSASYSWHVWISVS
jgi:hypothetical protein